MKAFDIPDAGGNLAMPRGLTVLGLALVAWAVVGGGAWTLLALASG